jgi:hypothetical protein
MGATGPQGNTGAKGDTGNQGLTGLSAYQVAQLAGFTGTEAQWLASLVGAQGDDGFIAQANPPVDTNILWLDTDEPAATPELYLPSSPTFSYTNGILTSISYATGETKSFTYTNGLLTRLDFNKSGVITRKTFNYTAGVLTSITQVVL